MTRTCQARGGGVRLFGVRLTDGSCIQKSASMGNILSHYSAATSSESPDVYHSDDPDHADRRRPIRKKGIAWTEEEHRQFLLGLEKLGKGDWRGISRNYVRSRTSTQVASHAQKYFIRQSNATRKKKRSSLFDMEKLSSSSPECQLSISTPMGSTKNGKPVLSSSSSSSAQMADTDNTMPCLDLSLKPAFTPFPFQLWPPNANSDEHNHPGTSLKVKQEPIHELMNLSQLTLGETGMLQNESLIFSLSIAGNP